MKMQADPHIDLTAPCPGTNGGKGRLAQAREMVEGRPRTVWRCTCGGCGAVDGSVHNTNDEKIVAANLSRKGWRGFGRRIRCPACAVARKPATPPCLAPAPPPPVPERPAIMCSATAPANILNAAKVGRHLDLYWLDTAGRYEDGWTDERIGQDLGGVAPDFVRSIREGLGKVPKRPAEIVEAERRLAALETSLTAAEGQLLAQIKALRTELDACRALVAQAETRWIVRVAA